MCGGWKKKKTQQMYEMQIFGQNEWKICVCNEAQPEFYIYIRRILIVKSESEPGWYIVTKLWKINVLHVKHKFVFDSVGQK